MADEGQKAVTSRRLPVGVLALAVALFVVYLLTARYGHPYGTDAFTNAAQARAFAEDQDPILEELDGLENPRYQGVVAWFTESPGGTTAQYPPGTALWAAPFYVGNTSYETRTFFDPKIGQVEVAVPTTYVPAAVAAGLSVALAMLILGLTLVPTMSERQALAAMGAAGLGTSAWSVAADEIWQHGPAMMCISAGNYLISRDRPAASGLAFAAAILVRPHTAVIAAAIGLAIAISRRSLRELVYMGGASALGLAALLAYNNAVFGSYSVSGGYGSSFADRLVNDSPFIVIERLVDSLIHTRVGMIWTSPFLVIVFVAIVMHRRSCPDWSIGAAIGGLLYLVVQFRANRVTGGAGFFGYRYPLEALMAAAPMMAIATRNLLREYGRIERLFKVLVALSIAMHGAGAVLT